ncbi:MAG: DUF1934 domain-containing protein [Christensenella sp.]|uniref:DUF1934 domain-containing protein n=1 Tax=Christensenella sp. TaxID=1935934 RepID=UPI002B214C29|nr:DUF1934 domain-containing protein [Christensenella sp.]MEA5003587.1 DUF1934 domain-containing protein [Christensenella sp.]
MVQNNILLNVRGYQADEDDNHEMELYTEGMLTCDGGKYTIEYDESELSGMENTKTSLTIDGDRVQLKRTGLVETEFVFLKSRVFAAAYDTPFGMMEMSVFPTQVLSELSTDKGNIDLEYVIRVGDQQAVNKLNINYRSIPKA